ncbi:MAG: bifunctional UDP-sugar hydrolase/5'-nucleotidase [Atopobiaceae bacterium]|nr:bifunctional UDP-sugar hydrolase/5'-nucleotidase [Atopobiaceae bacterium]
MRLSRTICTLVAMVALMLTGVLASPAQASAADSTTGSVRILCTTDIHSQDIPGKFKTGDTSFEELGGFARLATALSSERIEGQTLVVDSGDFSEGTMFSTLLTTRAPELHFLGELGYDAVALGNHDFDYGDAALRQELAVFSAEGAHTQLLCSNLVAAGSDTSQAASGDNPLSGQGVANYTTVTVGGHKVGLFSVMGKEAADYTSTTDYAFADATKTAQATADTLRNQEGCDLVVLLSHAGTVTGEDQALAKDVSGIDVIVSGHAHVTTDEPISINGCTIVSPGYSLEGLGVLDLTCSDGTWSVDGWKVDPLDATVADDPQVASELSTLEGEIQQDYLGYYGITAGIDDTVATSGTTTETLMDMDGNLGNHLTANFVADAYASALEQAGVDDVDICVTPTGSIRNAFYQGDVTCGDLFDILSLYQSPGDGKAGSPLVTACLTGSDVWNLCEVSASISDLMSGVQLAFSGLRFSYDPDRLFMNRVYQVEAYDKDTGQWVEVPRDDTLYKVSTTQEVASQLSLVHDQSYGMLSINLRDEGGALLGDDLSGRVVTYQTTGGETRELKEWIALYQYVQTFDKGADGLPQVFPAGTTVDERTTQGSQGFLAEHLTGLNTFAWVVYGAVVAVVALVVGTVFLVRHLIRRHRAKRAAAQA